MTFSRDHSYHEGVKYLALGQRLKVLRERRKISLESMAEQLAISKEKLEKIEADEEQPLIGHLIQMANVFQVNVAEILRDRLPTQSFEIIRQNERERVRPFAGPKRLKMFDYQYEFLTQPSNDKHLNAFMIEVSPQQSKPPRDDITHPGEEFIYLLEGRLEGEIDGTAFYLEPGDSLFLRSTQPHVFFNPGSVPARALTVIYPY